MEKEQKETKVERKVEVVESTTTHTHDPFTIVEHNGEFMVALGNQIISRKKFNKLQLARNYINSKPWEIILNASAILVNRMQEMSNLKNEKQ